MNLIFKKALILSGGLFLFFFLSVKTSLAVDCNPYPPLGGLYTITTTPSCSFAGTPNGADNGGITVSTGVNLIIPASSTVAWSSGQTITLNGTASVSVNTSGGQFSQTNLWMVDADADGWPGTSTQTAAANSPGGTYARRNTLNSGCFNTSTGAWTLDCNDAAYSLTNSCCTPTTWYQDSDSDTYGNASVSTSSCTQPGGYVANSTDCDDTTSTKYQTLSCYVDADGDTYTTGGAVNVCKGAACTSPAGHRAAANGADCNDGNASVWQNLTGYSPDADADGYGVNASSVCSGASLPGGYVANGGDCYDSNANAKPGQTAYYTTNRGDGSFDYNCDGSGTFDQQYVQSPQVAAYVSFCGSEHDTCSTCGGKYLVGSYSCGVTVWTGNTCGTYYSGPGDNGSGGCTASTATACSIGSQVTSACH